MPTFLSTSLTQIKLLTPFRIDFIKRKIYGDGGNQRVKSKSLAIDEFWCSIDFIFMFENFIYVKQHPRAGPETTRTLCEKFEAVVDVIWK